MRYYLLSLDVALVLDSLVCVAISFVSKWQCFKTIVRLKRPGVVTIASPPWRGSYSRDSRPQPNNCGYCTAFYSCFISFGLLSSFVRRPNWIDRPKLNIWHCCIRITSLAVICQSIINLRPTINNQCREYFGRTT